MCGTWPCALAEGQTAQPTGHLLGKPVTTGNPHDEDGDAGPLLHFRSSDEVNYITGPGVKGCEYRKANYDVF